MKHLILFFLLLPLNKSCSQTANQERVVNSIVYSAMTRGSSYHCSIDENSIRIESNGISTTTKIDTIKPEEWSTLVEAINSIDLSEIHNYKSATKDSAHDGARITTLEVTVNGVSYYSAPFDEGAPPTELKSLIDMILALAETVE